MCMEASIYAGANAMACVGAASLLGMSRMVKREVAPNSRLKRDAACHAVVMVDRDLGQLLGIADRIGRVPIGDQIVGDKPGD